MTTGPTVVVWSHVALQSLQEVGSKTLQQKIYAKVGELARVEHPERVGKPLRDELRELYRIPFGRYRILYRVELHPGAPAQVEVVLVGIRKAGDKNNVYDVATRLRRRGAL